MTFGVIATYLLGVWALLSSLTWIFAYVRGGWTIMRMPRLRDAIRAEPSTWPRLSIIVPACNEEDTLEPAVRTMLAQDYPNLELVLINDRSTDKTGQIVDRLAESDARIRAVHIKNLPAQWLGKVHALSVGCRQASGEWLLLSDADVHFGPSVLRKTIALSEARPLDHLTLFPHMKCNGILHEALVSAFGGFFFQSFRAHKVTDPNAKDYVGLGAFNLVRKAALDKSQGFQWLRMEVADDVGLGLLLKQSGARSDALLATEELAVEWYSGVMAMARGLEKNLYPIMGRYNPAFFGLRFIGLLLLLFGPFVGLAHPSPVRWVCLTAIVSVVPFAAVLKRVVAFRLSSVLLIPIGQLIFAGIALNSAIKCIARGAIEWRGTRYSLEELRQFQRVKI